MAGAATAQRTNFHQGLKFGLLTERECNRQWRTANRKSIELRQAAMRLSIYGGITRPAQQDIQNEADLRQGSLPELAKTAP